MFCTKCGKAVADGQKFCTSCGAPLGQAPTRPAPAPAPVQPAPAAPARPAGQAQPVRPVQPAAPASRPVRQAPAAAVVPPRKKKLGGGIIALIITTVVLAAAAIALLVFFLLRGSGDKKETSAADKPGIALPALGGDEAADAPAVDLPAADAPVPGDSFTVPAAGFDLADAEGTYHCAQEPGSTLELYDLGEQLSIYKTYRGKTDISALIPTPTTSTFTIRYDGRLVEFSWSPASAGADKRVVVSEGGEVSVFTPDGDRNWVIDAEPSYADPFEDPNGYILPTDSRYITEDELYAFDKEQVKLIRNEIYARYGYTFTLDKFQDYFRGKNWYCEDPSVNVDTFGTQNMNEFERANVDVIRTYEKRMGW